MSRIGALLTAAALLGTLAFAQDSSPATPAQPADRYEQKGGDRAAERLRHMSKELNLTDDQKEKLKPILQDEAQQMKSVQADNSLSTQQRRKKMREIHKTYEPQVQAVLTPEQKDKLKSMKQEGRQGRRWRRRQQSSPDSSSGDSL
jgi:periplasmic protein CpxP/Spy